jgi:spheroidene monooxygenase
MTVLNRHPAADGPARGSGAAAVPGLRGGDTAARATGATHAVLMLVHYRRRHLPWGLARLVLGPAALGRPPGLRFAKVLGSGRDGGFGLAPGLRYQGLLAFFADGDSAEAFARGSSAVSARQAHADRWLLGVLRVTSARGSWDGHTLQAAPDLAPESPASGPLAVLTRASILPRQALRFWRHSPGSERALARAEGCRLAIGLGEAPVLRQATVSVWDSVAAMRAYAAGGAHGHAARQAWSEGWFSEWLFARFEPLWLEGTWEGWDGTVRT